MCSTVLASGRFDPPHLGHLASMQRLGKQFKKVIVVVLDHEGQKYSPQYRAQILKEVLNNSEGTYEVVINKDHFGQISKEAAAQYGKYVYASGNLECVKHMDELGYECLYIDRAYNYEASEDRHLRNIMEAMNK